MTEVSGWIFTICSGALICGIVSALIPGKSYEGAIQLLLGLLMLFCFLTPLSAGWEFPQVDLDAAEQKRQEIADQTQQRLTHQVERDSQRQLQRSAEQSLGQFGIKVDEIRISLVTDGDHGAYASVVLPERSRERHGTLLRVLEYELGIPVRITYGS